MDQMESFDHQGWQFLISGEQLPSGLFQAVVRYRRPPDGLIRTLVLDPSKQATAPDALAHARALAMQWADRNADSAEGA